jgi:hypothetical protein
MWFKCPVCNHMYFSMRKCNPEKLCKDCYRKWSNEQAKATSKKNWEKKKNGIQKEKDESKLAKESA